MLTLGFCDSKSFIPLDFSLHNEPGKTTKRGLKKKELDAQFSKKRTQKMASFQRALEVSEDLDLKTLPKESNTYVLFGGDDKFINKKQINDYEHFLGSNAADCQLIKFKGKHDIPKNVLLEQALKNNW